jgi:hypothetical protein
MLDSAAIREAVEGNSLRNSELLAVLQAKGVPLDMKQKIDFHFWAWHEADAHQLSGDLSAWRGGVGLIASVEPNA